MKLIMGLLPSLFVGISADEFRECVREIDPVAELTDEGGVKTTFVDTVSAVFKILGEDCAWIQDSGACRRRD